jgi:transposase
VPAPLDFDLRERAVAAYAAGGVTLEQVAARFVIGTATLKRWRARLLSTGSVEPLPHVRGRAPKVDAAGEAALRERVAEQPDAYCWELAERLEARVGVNVDEDTIGRTLRRLGLTRKKRR